MAHFPTMVRCVIGANLAVRTAAYTQLKKALRCCANKEDHLKTKMLKLLKPYGCGTKISKKKSKNPNLFMKLLASHRKLLKRATYRRHEQYYWGWHYFFLCIDNWYWIGDFWMIDIETCQLSFAIIDIEVKEPIGIEWYFKNLFLYHFWR